MGEQKNLKATFFRVSGVFGLSLDRFSKFITKDPSFGKLGHVIKQTEKYQEQYDQYFSVVPLYFYIAQKRIFLDRKTPALMLYIRPHSTVCALFICLHSCVFYFLLLRR